MKSPKHQKRYIQEYVELETDGEKVVHLEKVSSEHVLGKTHDVWDVHTDKHRWWVVTDLINLYSQEDFRSMDHVISYHIGAMARLLSRQRASATDEEKDRLSSAWRRFDQAGDALDAADEAEEFQAVGMRCRECLLAFIREVARDDMVPKGEESPKRADFINWSRYIASAIAPGSSLERLRSYMRANSKATWEYIQWLTHASDAVRFDAEIAIEAVGHLLSVYGHAMVRQERGIPDRCPRCSSYRLERDYRDDINAYVTLCESCEWESAPENIYPR